MKTCVFLFLRGHFGGVLRLGARTKGAPSGGGADVAPPLWKKTTSFMLKFTKNERRKWQICFPNAVIFYVSIHLSIKVGMGGTGAPDLFNILAGGSPSQLFTSFWQEIPSEKAINKNNTFWRSKLYGIHILRNENFFFFGGEDMGVRSPLTPLICPLLSICPSVQVFSHSWALSLYSNDAPRHDFFQAALNRKFFSSWAS